MINSADLLALRDWRPAGAGLNSVKPSAAFRARTAAEAVGT
jgi:hypothetical protein